MIEKEYKWLVEKEEFLQMIHCFSKNYKCKIIEQKNYYYDSKDFYLDKNKITLRVREKNGELILRLKWRIVIQIYLVLNIFCLGKTKLIMLTGEQELVAVSSDSTNNNSSVLRAGRATTSGTYPTRKGVVLVTPNNDSSSNLKIVGHAGIVLNDTQIIHAVGKGVVYGNNDWYDKKPNCYGVSNKSTSYEEDCKAAEWCETQIGSHYTLFCSLSNTDYDKGHYCSQLVHAAFKYKTGGESKPLEDREIGILFPMEIANSDKVINVYTKN